MERILYEREERKDVKGERRKREETNQPIFLRINLYKVAAMTSLCRDRRVIGGW